MKNGRLLSNAIKLLLINLILLTFLLNSNSNIIAVSTSSNYVENQIKVLIVYNSSAPVNWASNWVNVLTELNFETQTTIFQEFLENSETWENYDIMLFDDSLYSININDALIISEIRVPLILCGKASSFINTLENIQGQSIVWNGSMEIHTLALNHQIFHKPYPVSSNNRVVLSLEGWNTIAYNYSDIWCREFTILGLSNNVVVSAFYTGLQNYKAFWIAVNDPSKFTIKGRQFIANVIQYLTSVTNFSILGDYIANLQIHEWHGEGGVNYPFLPDIESTYHGYTILQLIDKENLVNTTSIVNHLISNYDPFEGSFTNTWDNMEIPSDTSKSCATSFAIIILNQTNSLELINVTKVASFLAACQDVSGGFADSPGGTETNIINTWAVLEALKVLNALNMVNVTAAIEYLSQCQNLDVSDPKNYGGFMETPSSTRSKMFYTYHALRSLQILSSLSSANLTAVTEWILKCKRSDGSFYNDLISLDENQLTLGTGYAVLSLKILGKEDLIDDLTGEWLLDRQLSVGGFSGGIGDEFPQISETYVAVMALKTLRKTSSINITALEKYLLSCWSPDGGFYPNSFLEGSLWQAYNAIKILSILNMINKINKTSLIEFLNATFSVTLNTYWEIPITRYEGFTIALPLEIHSTYGLWSYGRGMEFFATAICQELNTQVKAYDELVNEILISEITDSQSPYYGLFKILSIIPENVWSPNFYTTVFAVLTLDKLEATSLIVDKRAVTSYIVNRQVENGSIIPEPLGRLPWPIDAWSASEYYAVAALSALKSLSALNISSLTHYLISNLDYKDVIGTYYAIKALKILFDNNTELHVFEQVNKSAVLELAYKTLRGNFTFVNRLNSNSVTNRLQYTWMMLSVLKDLGLLPLLEESLEIQFKTLTLSKTNLYLGEDLTISAFLTDNFGRKLENATFQAKILNYIFNGTYGNESYQIKVTIPVNGSLLGPQEIEIKAFKKGYLGCSTIKKITVYGFLKVNDYFSASKVFVGEKINITIHVEVGNVPLEQCTINITVLELNSTLNVTYIGNGNYTTLLDTSKLTPGNYTVNIKVYHPYTNSYNISKVIEVTKAQTEAIVEYSPLNVKVFKEIDFNITLQTIKGTKINDTLTIKIRDENGLILIEENLTTLNGFTTFSWTPTSSGKHILEINYQGNDYFMPTNYRLALTVSKLKTAIETQIINENITTILIKLVDEDGNPIIGEIIVLEIRFPNNTTKTIYLTTGSKGNATYQLETKETGTYQIKVTFEGSSIYEASTAIFSINKEPQSASSSNENVNRLSLENIPSPENIPFTVLFGILAVVSSFTAVRYKKKFQIAGGGSFEVHSNRYRPLR